MTEHLPAPEDDDLPEQMQVRHDKRARLLADGRQPYPVTVPRTHSLAAIRAEWGHLEADATTGVTVSVSARVIFFRNTGKLCFATLRDGDGTELQVMLSLDKIGEDSLADWKSDVDIGDFVSVTGEVISSKRGELSVLADAWQMAAKALRPLPVAHKPLSEETRVRQRYVDLIMRDDARRIARMRPQVMQSLRSSFAARNYTEVETPMLQVMHGGAAARPFATHSNAFDMQLFLRIAPELFLKRCVVGGIDRVFEINRNFRNEGADSSHSPEFAMLEFYEAYADYRDMARTLREIIQEAAMAVHGSLQFTLFDGREQDLSGEWGWVSMYPALSEAVGTTITPETPIEQLRSLAELAGIEPEKTWVPGKYVEELFEHHVIGTFTGPTFVADFPEDTSPLTRAHRDIPGVVEKWDLYINGFEQGTGYSELIDPVIQRDRLVAQSLLGARGDVEAMQVDEDFLRALEHGAPPMGGVGMGVDRLLMALTGLGHPRNDPVPAGEAEVNARHSESVTLPDGIVIRPATTADGRGIRRLIDSYIEEGRIVRKPLVEIFESVQEFLVAEHDKQIIACGALHVMWEDLGEIRTMAVAHDHLHKGLGGIILEMLIDRARMLGLSRLFCLTFETDFFSRHGFQAIAEAPVSPQVYEALLESRDEGVAEMLGLERVKPNTLGNTRMLRFI